MTTSALTKAALAAKRAKGEMTGSAPYGWRLAADGKRLEPAEDEQAVLTAVRALAASGTPQRAIARELAARGVRSRDGGLIGQSQIQRMLARAREAA